MKYLHLGAISWVWFVKLLATFSRTCLNLYFSAQCSRVLLSLMFVLMLSVWCVYSTGVPEFYPSQHTGLGNMKMLYCHRDMRLYNMVLDTEYC